MRAYATSETPQTEREGEREADTDGVPTTLQGPPLRHRSGIYLDCTERMSSTVVLNAFSGSFLMMMLMVLNADECLMLNVDEY